MARRKPDTVKSAAPGFQAILNRGELPAGTKTAGDLAREQSDPTRYGYQPPLPSRPRPTAPARKGGGGAQPNRTRAPSPGLPRNPPLPPPRPGLPPNPGFKGLDRNIPSPFPELPGVPDVPDPMTTAGLRPEWGVGDAGFGGPTQMANPLPIPAMANAQPRPGISTPGAFPPAPPPGPGLAMPSARSGAMAMPSVPPIGTPPPAPPGINPAAPPGMSGRTPAAGGTPGAPIGAGGSGIPMSNMPTIPGATSPLPPGLLDSVRKMFGGM